MIKWHGEEAYSSCIVKSERVISHCSRRNEQ